MRTTGLCVKSFLSTLNVTITYFSMLRVSSSAPVVAHLCVGCAAVRPVCQLQLRRLPAADPSQLTSGEMADLDGSDASPPESQGEFLPTDRKFYSDKLCTQIHHSLNDQTLFCSSEDFNLFFLTRCLDADREVTEGSRATRSRRFGHESGINDQPAHPASRTLKHDLFILRSCLTAFIFKLSRLWSDSLEASRRQTPVPDISSSRRNANSADVTGELMGENAGSLLCGLASCFLRVSGL